MHRNSEVPVPQIQRMIVCAVACGFSLMHESPVSAELPPDVRTALERYITVLSPIRVKWFKTVVPVGDASKVLRCIGLNPDGLDFFEARTVEYIYDFPRSFMYEKYRAPKLDQRAKMIKGEFVELDRKAAFDGRKYYNANPNTATRDRGGSPFLHIHTPQTYAKAKSRDTKMMAAEYFEAIGIDLPNTVAKHFSPQVTHLLLGLADSGAAVTAEEALHDENGTILRVTARTDGQIYTFDLDPAHGYTTLRLEKMNTAGRRMTVCECERFIDVDDSGLLLPQRVVLTYYWYRSRPEKYSTDPLFTETFSLLAASKESVNDDQFVISYNDVPGSFVTDETRASGKISYRIPANADDLDRVIERARRGGTSERRSYTVMLIVANLVVLALATAIYFWRRHS